MNLGLDDDTILDMLNEVDLNKNGRIELDEFLEVRESLVSVFRRFHMSPMMK